MAVAEHLDPVGDRAHLVEAMSDVDDRDALGLQAADEAEQHLCLVMRQRSRRLVEDEQSRRAGQGARDLDDLAFADPEVPDSAVGVDVHLELVEDHPRARRHRTPIDDAEPVRIRPSEMFSATDNVAASWNSWKMIATPSSRARRGVSVRSSTPS